MSIATWERIVEARSEADSDLSIRSKLHDWAKARQERDLVQGRLPEWQVEQAARSVLNEQGVASYRSVAIGLARLNHRDDSAEDATAMAQKIAAGVVLYEGIIDLIYQGFNLLFEHAAKQFYSNYTRKAVA